MGSRTRRPINNKSSNGGGSIRNSSFASGGVLDLCQCHGIRVAHVVEHVRKLGIFRGATSIDDVVAAYIATLDLASFDPKAPPQKTAAFWDLEWLQDRKNRRAIPHRMESCGYTPVRNDAAKDGLWKINNARQAVYAKSELSLQDRLRATSRLLNSGQSSQ